MLTQHGIDYLNSEIKQTSYFAALLPFMSAIVTTDEVFEAMNAFIDHKQKAEDFPRLQEVLMFHVIHNFKAMVFVAFERKYVKLAFPDLSAADEKRFLKSLKHAYGEIYNLDLSKVSGHSLMNEVYEWQHFGKG